MTVRDGNGSIIDDYGPPHPPPCSCDLCAAHERAHRKRVAAYAKPVARRNSARPAGYEQHDQPMTRREWATWLSIVAFEILAICLALFMWSKGSC